MSFDKSIMTIISTASQTDVNGNASHTFEQAYVERTPAFPPVTDTIVWIQHIDWADVRERCRGGVNNVGLVVAVIGEKLYDLGSFLAKV
jgi:hypothetical protein